MSASPDCAQKVGATYICGLCGRDPVAERCPTRSTRQTCPTCNGSGNVPANHQPKGEAE